ncbi:cytochrome b562 [Acinetobacter sp. LoGeW2-3]|uniref:cytochrome b562 n=1 Tax=Acinetobacter sp. LoGeW2-3 TaxID=1808001 RepID=UPI00148A448D|nr:cytochrome b562 [Acinetobacter sp. LoGeW2-3]
MLRILSLTILCLLGGTMNSSVMAKSLRMDMYALNSNYKTFQNTTDPKVALDALEKMNQAALDAQKTSPKSLKKASPEDPQLYSYHSLLNQLISELKQAQALTEAGQLEQAKQSVEKIDAIKKQGHQNFK